MRHPGVETLALYAGGEGGVLRRWRLAAHLNACPGCRREVEAFRRASAALRQDAAALPAGLDFSRLEAEMKANIRVGLAAGEIVGPVEPANWLGWRVAAGLALATVAVMTGWFLNVPRPEPSRGVVLQATQEGLELKENGRTLTLLQPATTAVTYTVNAEGSLRARYVDSDTGQVTITNVYAQ